MLAGLSHANGYRQGNIELDNRQIDKDNIDSLLLLELANVRTLQSIRINLNLVLIPSENQKVSRIKLYV